MTVSDIYLCSDNIHPGAVFKLYTKSSNYTNRELEWKKGHYYGLEDDILLCDVSSFFIEPDGQTVHVRVI